MAHIPDGVLSAPVLIAGAAVSLAGCGYALRRLDEERIPEVAILAAVFFVASLVHFPVGPTSVHLILNGLTGILLGWAAFPAIAVALLLQAVLFGFGGLVVLGVNIMNMAIPAVLCCYLFQAVAGNGANRQRVLWGAGLAGGLGVLLTAIMVAAVLTLSGREFFAAAKLVVVAHVPVALIEAAFSVAVIGLLSRVKPSLLGFQA
ncbi:cobalamin biosynthesis protein CbiM [Rhodomicrobium udaipurense JA643]|uniref:Cobalt transporter CbiM n=1 Tax=Rhodomicrobium udaipurense TaxID=1202716 RepID=A0A8I1GI40_9HYPH|nr:cobalt transporter CbiM [Rhodomicrobium udaipurense]KAI94238.1 cobalamin biosynthesis protein CbiM [Rhodomicrobium udaipurense JA643]MBJ7544025.1 cobalt transporter CbiM [Rhodomicrobium udaipurense]